MPNKPCFKTVDSIQHHLEYVFGQRNMTQLNTMAECISLFAVAIRDLRQARRLNDLHLVRTAFARLGSRAFTFANADNRGVRISTALEAKYPLEGCAYCRRPICICGETRDKPRLRWDEVGKRSSWDLRDWQKKLEHVYGKSNRARGFDYVSGRLSDELVEIMALEHFSHHSNHVRVDREYPLEIADLMAWTLAAGNIAGVDVQGAIEWRYSNGCPTCHKAQCHCTQHEFDHVYAILG